MKKEWNAVKETVIGFLTSTTIHGCRYLYEGRDALERVAWGLVLIACFCAASIMIGTNLDEASKDPILTTLHTTDVKNVPFPAVTIAGDATVDPWGFTEKLLNTLAFYDPMDKNNPSMYEKSKDLRQRFSFIMDKVYDKMAENLTSTRHNWTLDEIKEYGKVNEDYREIQRAFPTLSQIAPKLAAVLLSSQRSFNYAEQDMKDLFVDSFFDLAKFEMSVFTKNLKNLIDEKVNETKYAQELLDCQKEAPACIENLKLAYSKLYVPYEINKFPFDQLGFGTFLRYFSVLMTKYETQVFLNSKNLRDEEVKVRMYLSEIFRRMFGSANQIGGTSTFEFVKILHETKDYELSTETPSSILMDEMNCVFDQKNSIQSKMKWEKDFCKNTQDQNEINCCMAMDVSNYSLNSTLKIMRYSLPPPSYNENITDFLSVYGNLDFLGNYTNITGMPSYERDFIQYNPNAKVLMCKYKGQVDSWSPLNCDLFHRSITNEGFGYTFNHANFRDIFSTTKYTSEFASIMRPKGYNKDPSPSEVDEEDEDQRWVYPREGVLFPKTSGPAYGLNIILQTPTPVKVAIHDPMSIGDLRSTGVEVEPGYISTFLITPSQIVTSKNAKGLPLKQRQCQFPFESSTLKLFTEYSQSACQFECQLKEAYRQCQCIPWNYPQFEDDQPLCHRFGRQCFEAIMGDTNVSASCNCLYDCATTRYSFSVSSTAFDAEALCRGKDSELSQQILSTLGTSGLAYPPKFMRRYQQVVNGDAIGNDDICKENLKSVAIVKFQLASQIITRIKKTERVSFSDLLSNIGGVLGLFTGMSISSLFEFVFWLQRLVRKPR